ncbi:hypothetical protein E4U13_007997 [Claviceps humidiphila]|uniref:ABC transporter n=1 Tax=Claviceps humidiphila TaxID=1294629 RepID=A0A9P7Q848_9HYPO|nr:hypothetical protein E4U13_007997 [Claviceps humidiphila]
MAKKACSIDVHDVIGPTVTHSCLHGFDFTLLFEESILTLLPLLFTVVLLIPRAIVLGKKRPKVQRSWLFALKFVAYSIYIVLQIILLALRAKPTTPTTRLTIPVTTTVIASFIWLLYVSYLEHVRSVRPSTILCLYFGISSLLDLASSRTSFFIPGYDVVAPIHLSSYFVKLVILSTEVVEKRKLLMWHCKNVSPEALASFYNRVFFVWLNGLLLKGYRTSLTLDTLTPLDQDILGASRPDSLLDIWERANKRSKNALLWVFICHYRWHLLAGVLPRLAYVGFTFAEPFLVKRVLDFMAEPEGPNTRNFGYGLIGAYALVHIGKAMSLTWYEHMTYRVITMFRGSLIHIIYGKTLRLDARAVLDAEAITLISADIDRISLGMQTMHDSYASVIELSLSLWLLSNLLGIAVVPPTIFIALCLAVGIPIATAAGNAQVPWLEAIEKRLAVTSKTLGNMKAIRMTGLTDAIHKFISSLRTQEIQASRLFRLLSVLQTGAANCTFTFAPVLGLGAFAILAKSNDTETLTEGVAFAVLSLFQLQDRPVMSLLHGFEDFHTISSAFYRVQTYVLSTEREDHRKIPALTPINNGNSRDTRQKLVSISATDRAEENPLAAEIQSFRPTSSVIRLTDAAGGYSSGVMIVKNLNLDITRGKITMIVGPVGSGKSTFLKLLLGELPQVLGTITTQQSTCAFASQSPWISWGTVRSNILGMSPWNDKWYKSVVDACSLGVDFLDLPDGDQTRTGPRGSRLSGGQQMRVSLARALYSRKSLLVLDDILTGLDRATEASILENVFGCGGIIKTIQSTAILATNTAGHLRFADHIIILNQDGVVSEQGTFDQVSTSGGYLQHLSNLSSSTTSRHEAPELSGDVYRELGLENEVEEQVSGRQTSDLQIYSYYIRVAGKLNFCVYVLICAAYTFGLSFPSIWLQWWTDYNTNHPNGSIEYWLSVYFGLAALAIFGCMTSDCATTTFLTSTNIGSTTNRFGQDLQLIDSDLPQSLDKTILNFLGVLVSAVLVFTGSAYVAVCLPVCIALVFIVQKFYLRTSRQLRLLDIEAKAPLFSHLIETLNGLITVRAYGWSAEYVERSYDVLDASQKPYYLLWCIQRWLNLVLDLLAGGIAVILVAFATMMRSGTTGLLGVALFNVINFGGALQTFITEWTQLETALGAISRMKAFTESTQLESSCPNADSLPNDWPSTGHVVFENMAASYEKSGNSVLNGIDLNIRSGEKIALCGRTGSGKSSLLLTILGMLELEAGSITIDGHNISRIPREELRKRLNTLPQEPFFLQGSVRENADPLQLSTDERIIKNLITVRLWEILESRGGLDAPLSEDELSHGQRQLFCLARAITRPGNIVIVDEATSSVDSETDELMQRVIQEELKGRTLIAVAHKLHTVVDYDRIVLIDKGKIVECGNPRVLLQNSTSAFYKLYTSTARNAAG